LNFILIKMIAESGSRLLVCEPVSEEFTHMKMREGCSLCGRVVPADEAQLAAAGWL
jgi:predicted peroxiredoxin